LLLSTSSPFDEKCGNVNTNVYKEAGSHEMHEKTRTELEL